MSIWFWIMCAVFLPWMPKRPDGAPTHPFAWVHLGAFLWTRLRETDAEKAQRLIARSQRLLERARKLTLDAQHTAALVDNEFEKRLRLVAGDEKESD